MRRSSPEKIKLWIERLARFPESNQSVSSFCQSEGFSQPSFYQWKLMKQIGLGRKNWLFAGSVAGGERNAGFMTFVSSAHRNDVNAHQDYCF